MNNKIFYKYIISLILLLPQSMAWSFTIYDSSGVPIPEKMDQEEARLNLLNTRTNEIVQSHGRYMMVRDTLYLSNAGIKYRSTKWFSDATVWLTTLDFVVSAFQNSNITTLSSSTVRNQIRAQINKAYIDFQSLARESMDIRKISQQSLSELGKIRRVKAPFVTDFDAPIVLFVSKVITLEDGVIRVNNTLNKTFINSTALAMRKTQEASDLLLKNAVLNTQNAAIVTQLKIMQAALLAESIFAPYYADLLNLNLKINTLVSDSMAFTAKRYLTEMEALAQIAIAALNGAGLTPTESQGSIDKITSLLSRVQNSVALIMNSPEAAVLRLYRRTTNTPATMCKFSFGQKKYNCQLLKTLGGLLDQDIMTMPMGDLRVLEDAMRRIYDGPLGSATGGI